MISNSSPLILFGKINGISLLEKIFNEIIISNESPHPKG